jgi:hypothetical protein
MLPQSATIILGGADGMTITISAGHVVVTPPHGPLANPFQGTGW